jgi:hypothetical protein
MRPRIFVGTMSSGEGDFQECLRVIQTQLNVDVTHYVIAGLPEKDAHNALWSAWRTARGDHDLFVKVDADTVLKNPTILEEVWKQFDANPRVTAIQAPLWDYMTDGLINGLNCFSPLVTFNDSKSELYCDRGVDTGHDIVLHQAELPQSLIPAAFHCKYASELQAFHYGIHRALKNHHETIAKVHSAWTRYYHDRVRGFALIGASWCNKFSSGQFNYTDPLFIKLFNEAKETYDIQIARLTAS